MTIHSVCRRMVAALLILSLLVGLTGCASGTAPQRTTGETITFTDSCGRTVELPAEITAIVPSGSLAQMVLLSLCPELLVGLSSNLSRTQRQYLSAAVQELPVLGSFYAGGSTMNFEAVIGCSPDVIIDIGETKTTIAEDMDQIQERTNTPTIFIEGTIDTMAEAMRTLGSLLGCEARGEELADYMDAVLADITAKSALIPEEDRISVLYGDGEYGLEVKSAGTVHTEIFELVGADNVAQSEFDGEVTIEQVLLWDPDVVILTPDANYDDIFDDPVWSGVRAVQTGQVYEAPYGPYNWIDKPPSLQRFLGIQWLAQVLYPGVYDYDLVSIAQEFYRLFYGYELTQDEAMALMCRSLYA